MIKQLLMEYNTDLIEPLLEKFKDYGKTSMELVKLKSIDKTSDILSTLLSRLFFVLAMTLFLVSLNIAIALWLGDLLGKTYDGFLVVAAFYGIIGIILYFMQPAMKARINDSIIRLMIN